MSSSQRVLKCTMYGSDHSRLHCLVIWNSCSGDKRRCDCQSGPPPQKKRTQKARSAPSQSDDPDPDYKKLYSKLVQRHERVRNAFQSLKMQNEELAAELGGKNREIEELNSHAQEPADLVKTKEQVIQESKKSQVEAKTRISAMQEEIRKFAGFWYSSSRRGTRGADHPLRQLTQSGKHPWTLQQSAWHPPRRALQYGQCFSASEMPPQHNLGFRSDRQA